MPNDLVIAIDGPSASGKSTVSHLVARRLGVVYVDSGALYRGLTWKFLREDVDPSQADRVLAVLTMSQWEFFVSGGTVHFLVDGEDPWEQLRSAEVREKVADVAAIPEVRQFVCNHLRGLRRFGSLVMEGRDIGSVVFPESAFKYYLDADPEERARRRYREVAGREEDVRFEEIKESLLQRDQKDSTRPTAPLQIPLGAKVINTTGMSVEQVVDLIVRDVRSRIGSKQFSGQ
ncbi:MAG TPA: (d)CMP kinase [Kiritimatiellae bacterium]|nr:(d)CMP kinase [Kiritimatiellia bacterium]